uniref:Glypican-1 n=1 Tax=Poecilia reticulata TaxID=8081 RepID=A0A3P9QBY0_POERE
MRLCVLLCAVVGLCAAPGSVSGADRSCGDLRQFYTGKGFTLEGVPLTEISGHPRLCPWKGACTSALLCPDFFLCRLSAAYFTELHGQSERSLQEVLSPLGPLYSQNARLFAELYGDLRQYYRGSALNLDENLSEFWSQLLERTFKASVPVNLSEDYLECVAKQQETLRPFGEIPRDMKTKVIRAFVTARSFVQGLLVSSEVIKKVSQVSLAEECTKALMKLVYCPHCRGLASVQPCSNYCSNVMKGCLANQADLDPVWQELIDTMIQVASSFSTEPSLDVVLSSIPIRIYEAVHYLQENMDTFTAKVYQTCGSPGEPGTGSPNAHEQKKKSGSLTAFEYKPSPTAGLRLEIQVSDLSSKLRDMRQYWVQLPVALCSKLAAESNSQDNCWNGMTKARYLPGVMGDGLANQINNPEVDLDITKPIMKIRQQIMELKIMSNRLKDALEGNDVDFQDASEDISGSGSGMCLSGQCARSRPGLYAYAPETKPVGGAATPGIGVPLLLLPFTVLLLQR